MTDDDEWVVRQVTGSASTRAYRCPGCDQEIRPATPHVVAWPASFREDGSDDDAGRGRARRSGGTGTPRAGGPAAGAAPRSSAPGTRRGTEGWPRDDRAPPLDVRRAGGDPGRHGAARRPAYPGDAAHRRRAEPGRRARRAGRPDPVATLVTLHPLPTHGGFMDSHVIRKASYRLPALAGVAVLRFNTRGTSSPAGTSEGAFDDGVGERFDVAAAIEFAEFHEDPPLPNRWLLGWSFGTDLALMHGLDPSITGAILLSPPLRFSDDAAPRRLGGVRQAGGGAGAGARRLPAAGRGPRAVRPHPAGRGDRRRRREAPVGRGAGRTPGARRGRQAGGARRRTRSRPPSRRVRSPA